jgi:hypothetical protein
MGCLSPVVVLAVAIMIVFSVADGWFDDAFRLDDVDRCLDDGGAWNYRRNRCEFNRETCEARGGRYTPKARGCEFG